MTPICVSFWGSPVLSANLLQKLIDNSRFEVAFVVTQPDKPRSRRGQIIQPSAVKEKAIEHQISVFTPENLQEEDIQKEINEIFVHFHVVLAYGKIIPKVIFDHPPRGAVNFHASLLPLLRGAAPIEFALWTSQSITGWSLQQIVSKLDAGDIIAQTSLNIDCGDHQYKLHKKMETLLLENANEILFNFFKENPVKIPQDETIATYCRKINPTDGKIDWKNTSVEIRDQARAIGYRPGVFTVHQNKQTKIFFDFCTSRKNALDRKYLGRSPGDLFIEDEQLRVVCGDQTALPIQALQISGKSKMSATDFVNGYMRPDSIVSFSS